MFELIRLMGILRDSSGESAARVPTGRSYTSGDTDVDPRIPGPTSAHSAPDTPGRESKLQMVEKRLRAGAPPGGDELLAAFS